MKIFLLLWSVSAFFTLVRYCRLPATLCARSSGQSIICGGLVSEYWEACFGIRGTVSTDGGAGRHNNRHGIAFGVDFSWNRGLGRQSLRYSPGPCW